MDETPLDNNRRSTTGQARGSQPIRPWHWRTILAALLALLAVEGQPVAASFATSGSAARTAEVARRHAAPAVQVQTASSPHTAEGVARDNATDARPDFRVTFASFGDAEAGQPFAYTIQVRNDGATSSVASVNAVVPPELTNVRVNAPGFVCTRRFTPSGAQAGTLVACMRNDLESGAVADVTIEANAPGTAGSYHLTAVADPRDEVAEADEGNNDADATIRVQG
jgi:hypothetical protein